jgi:hypothetical protein
MLTSRQRGYRVTSHRPFCRSIVGTEHKMQVADLVDLPQKSGQPRVVHSQKISRGDFIVEGVGHYEGHTRWKGVRNASKS